ncbi:MAG: SdrD B-like domain-containing protein [Anaerolineae bacterium]
MKSSVRLNPIIIGLIMVVGLFIVGITLLRPAIDDVFKSASSSDCGWRGEAYVWNDSNRDGKPDEDEAPLPNVSILVDDVQNNQVKVETGVTDTDGKTTLRIFTAGCPETSFEVYVEPIENYCATTPERISISQPRYNFGLALCNTDTR